MYKEVQVEVQHGVGGVLEFLSVMSDNEGPPSITREACAHAKYVLWKSLVLSYYQILWSSSGIVVLLACCLLSPFVVCVCAYYLT